MDTLWRNVGSIIAIILCIQNVFFVEAIDLDLDNTGKLKDVTRNLADSAMKYYDGNKPGGTPGLLPVAGAFNWWEAGALFGQMVEYWYYTGDNTYNDMTKQALIFQAGPDNNYEPENQTRTEGNDDQAFWAFAAMSAAEMKFPNPGPRQPSWLSLAQAVFNRQAARWDDKHCGGGLRWQFNPLNNGWMLKNTVSNACFFQLAARLAKYTKNDTYADWANKAYNWMKSSPLIGKNYEVYDSVGFSEQSCEDRPGMIQWTYNVGALVAGCAFMYNHTNGAQEWRDRIEGYLGNMQKVFFTSDKIMIEYACESQNNCNKDQRSFKAYLARWLAVTAQLAPFSSGQIMPLLRASATAAAQSCSPAADGPGCGRRWNVGKDDGERDIGNQMTAMSIVQANLIQKAPALADIKTGLSTSDPGAGVGGGRSLDTLLTRKMTAADKAGAWLLTLFILFVSVAGVFSLLLDGERIRDYSGFIGGLRSR